MIFGQVRLRKGILRHMAESGVRAAGTAPQFVLREGDRLLGVPAHFSRASTVPPTPSPSPPTPPTPRRRSGRPPRSSGVPWAPRSAGTLLPVPRGDRIDRGCSG